MLSSLKQSVGHTNISKIKHWGKLVAITGSSQMIIQAIGFFSGIIVLRLLSVQEYAFYTLANTMLGTMTVLADGGIAAGAMSQGGKVWKDREKLGTVIVTGLKLRKKFAIFSLMVSTPILIYLLRTHHASWLTVALIVISIFPAFSSAVTDSLLEVVPKLTKDIVSLQKNQLIYNIARLGLLGIGVFIFPWTFVALLSNGFPRIWANFKLRKICEKHADFSQAEDPVERENIVRVVKRVLPSSIYYCVSGQISIWIISIFGTTASLSQLGGLGRLSMLFSVFNILFATLVGPGFARLPDHRGKILKQFFSVQALLLLCSLFIVAGFYFFSDPILWILGKGFKGLKTELLLVGIGGCISMIGASTNQLLSSRGMVVPPVVFIPSIILVQIIMAFFLPLSTVTGVLLYGISTTGAIYLIRIGYFFAALKK